MTPDKISRWMAAHRAQTIAVAAVLVLGGGVLMAYPILRGMETKQLSLGASNANQLMQEAMANPAIFTGEPEDEAARLMAISDQLSRLHDGLVLAHVFFAKTAWRATLDYTEFTQRYVLKLAQLAPSLKASHAAVVQYDSAVIAFKQTNAKERMDAAQAVNQTSAEARRLTDLAYQDCVLLHTLTGQIPATSSRAMLSLGAIGPEPDAAITAFLPRLESVAGDAHLARKQFNPMARAAF